MLLSHSHFFRYVTRNVSFFVLNKHSYYDKIIRPFPQKYFFNIAVGDLTIISRKTLTTKIFRTYDDILGITDVNDAQRKVSELENNFTNIQKERRNLQNSLNSINQNVKSLNDQIDRTKRDDDKYLQLITQAHQLAKQLNQLETKVTDAEYSEQETFTKLSSALRESNEKEKIRMEKSRYLGLLASLLGTLIGIIGATITYYFRYRELHAVVDTSTNCTQDTHNMIQKLSSSISSQNESINKFLIDVSGLFGIDYKESLLKSETRKSEDMQQVLDHVSSETNRLESNINTIRDVLENGQIIEKDSEGCVLVIGSEKLNSILKKTEENIEWKMKLNSLALVASVYGVFAVVAPLVYYIFNK